MIINTKHRTEALEIMDDFALEGEMLRNALDKIATINQLLGGNRLTLQGVLQLINNKNQTITILDVGCGNGDMLRLLSDFGTKNDFNFNLIGIDANDYTINYAKKISENYSNIRFQTTNIFEESFKDIKYDILLCTLTLHHFKNQEINYLLAIFYKNSKLGIVINDLQRSVLAYRLFQALSFVFNLNKMSKEDGLVSILRGFKKQELVRFSENLNFKKFIIHWKWAFRYQWIIFKD